MKVSKPVFFVSLITVVFVGVSGILLYDEYKNEKETQEFYKLMKEKRTKLLNERIEMLNEKLQEKIEEQRKIDIGEFNV